jgi:hypothetical protein
MSKLPPAGDIAEDMLDRRPGLFSDGADMVKRAVLADPTFREYLESMVEEYMDLDIALHRDGFTYEELADQETLKQRNEVVYLLIAHFASAARRGAAAAKLKL